MYRNSLILHEYVPYAMDGCELWADASFFVELDGSNRVSDWGDLSPAQHDFYQTTANWRPNYNASWRNGLPAIAFYLPDLARLDCTQWAQSSANTIYVVYDNQKTNNDYGVLVDRSGSAGPECYARNNSTNRPMIYSSGSSHVTWSEDETGPAIIEFRWSGTTGWISVNDATPVSGTISSNRENFISIGAYHGSVGTQPHKGNIAVVGIFDRLLETDERAFVWNYLSGRYDIALAT